MLAFRVPYPHRGLYLLLGGDILYWDYLLRGGQLKTLCDLVHHLLRCADDEDPLVAFLQKRIHYLIAVVIIVALYWFFGTEIGSACRATGNNEAMVRALGVNTKVTKMIALTLSNGLVGLSGALICESQKYADIGMGTGAIVIGLAAIVIGEVLWRVLPGAKLHAFGGRLTSAVVGSIVYFLIRAIVLQMGMDANDMKLLSAIIVALALCVPVVWEKYQLRRAYARASRELPETEGATTEGGR